LSVKATNLFHANRCISEWMRMELYTRFSGYDFWLEDRQHKAHVRGFLDKDILQRITSSEDFLKNADAFLNQFLLSSPDTRKQEMQNELGDDLANFLFISSILNYGNIGTSETLSLHLMNLYRRYPFMFRPNDKFWVTLNAMNPNQAKKIMDSLLMPLSGLFRTDFRKVVVPNWIAMIKFLRNTCQGDAGNFFYHVIKSLMIKEDDPSALTIIQNLLDEKEREMLKKQLGMDFALGPKTGLLLLSVMTANRRGFGVLKGVSRDQVKGLKAPVDSAVIRVMLNTGLVKITYVTLERREGKFIRSAMTEACQKAMDMFAEKLSILPIELDEYIWAVGTMPCKHRGAFCFICPLTELCDSWKHGYVKESSGAEYLKRCFSFARPQTAKNALYLRGCHTCPHKSSCEVIDIQKGICHPKFGQEYISRRYSDSVDKLSPQEIGRAMNS